ncbi:hypothetical protein [Geomonas ferrireducens]|uniref:hypothetical protein n=1 Tax=Geomonas ferrireducens TaxID=2570227 RepID=UPI0010A7AE23|nr:hypothetical protein [Geomonas ferrireducens]
MGYSGVILVLGCVLPCLGLGLFCYLFKLYLDYLSELRGLSKTEPEYVREINKKLYMNNVETERDLL